MIGMRMRKDHRVNFIDSLCVKKRGNHTLAHVKRTFRKSAAINQHGFSAGKLYKSRMTLSNINDCYFQIR